MLVTGEGGLRRGECYPLRWRNCRIKERKLIVEQAEVIIKGVRPTGDPKSRRPRVVDMTDRVTEALGRHHGKRRHESLVFVQKNGRPFTDHSWRTLMARVEKEFADLQPGRYLNSMESLENTARRQRNGSRTGDGADERSSVRR